MVTAKSSPYSPLRRGREGDGDTHLPRIQSHSEVTSPSLQRRHQTVDVWVWEMHGLGSAVAASAFLFALASSGLYLSVSSSTPARSASEPWSCSLWQNAHFLAATWVFFFHFSLFLAVLEAAGHKLLSFQYHYFHTTGFQLVRAIPRKGGGDSNDISLQYRK